MEGIFIVSLGIEILNIHVLVLCWKEHFSTSLKIISYFRDIFYFGKTNLIYFHILMFDICHILLKH